MTTKDGGWAFPRPGTDDSYGQEGMTLRDYFAAKAMQSFLDAAHADPDEAMEWAHKNGERTHQSVARLAYIVADAMLTEREK